MGIKKSKAKAMGWTGADTEVEKVLLVTAEMVDVGLFQAPFSRKEGYPWYWPGGGDS